MNDDVSQSSMGSARSPRVDLAGQVTIRFAADALVGSGKNVSDQGVFFVADGSVPVKVTIEGREGELDGELVRVESMGAGKVGIAVKFDGLNPDLVDG